MEELIDELVFATSKPNDLDTSLDIKHNKRQIGEYLIERTLG